jgi:hypothetical protein
MIEIAIYIVAGAIILLVLFTVGVFIVACLEPFVSIGLDLLTAMLGGEKERRFVVLKSNKKW